MLNAVIRTALRYRLVTIALAVLVTAYGGLELTRLPIDVFPDLDRPRVTIMTEAPGMAPEEVETLITFPLEAALAGATGVETVRSSSAVGLSIVYVDFAWGSDPYVDRQIVAEKINAVADRLPRGVRPQLTPISSVMGQIMQIGIWSDGGRTDPIEVRTLADWVVRQRLLAVPGIAQVTTIGGGRKQFQISVDPDRLLKYDVTLEDVERAAAASNGNATGGYLTQGGDELLVRSLGRLHDARELEQVVVKAGAPRPVLLADVATVGEGAQVKRGDAAVDGVPAVILTIAKQPGADTRRLTEQVVHALDELKPTLPADLRINSEIYRQKVFIDASIDNVVLALRDGAVLVVIVLFLFLLDLRTTFITLTAIPLSIVATALVFKAFGLSINTMTLGGLAVAIGELVDDAIVDVENIFRRLKENRSAPSPRPPLRVVYEASSEVRNSIVFSTLLVVLVFIPLFALSGIEGRLFAPLGVAYIVSIGASLGVSLTVTPVLAYWLLPRDDAPRHATDGLVVRVLQRLVGRAVRFSIAHARTVLTVVAGAVIACAVVVAQLGRDFLPPFNEGSVQINVVLPPGTSLETSNRVGAMVDVRLKRLQDAGRIASFGRRTGRAESDEHAEGVNVSEIIVTLDPAVHRRRDEVLSELRAELAQVPGIVASVEQPLAHLISHMLSGVKAQVGIKLFGDDLATLRSKAEEMRRAAADVPGIADLMIEQQVEIPQLQIALDRRRLAAHGMTSDYVNEFVETALNGRIVSEVVVGRRKFDLVVRLADEFRLDPLRIRRLALNVPGGGRVPLSSVAEVREASGPNTIHRENAARRVLLQCNTTGRDLDSVVSDIRRRLEPIAASLPPGYRIEYGGQFESRRTAVRTIGLLGAFSVAGMFLALYTLFRSADSALQVLAALPMAALGAVAALVVTGQSLTVAALVGFISLAGIASRNGILLVAHYLHLIRYEGETFTPQMIERAGKERMAPMLMTALTAGIALVPLVVAAGEPGKEILYPVATVILGGLVSSTLLDFFVHPALFHLFGRAAAERCSTSTDPLDRTESESSVAAADRSAANVS